MKYLPFLITGILFYFLTVDIAFAKDLVDSAQTAQSMFHKIGIAAISIGITSGGILFALGMSHLGRMVLISGAIGACAILGAPAVISLLGRIFGSSL